MLLYILDLFGVAVFAVSGALVAGRKSLDIFGVIVIAVVTAIGGGTIRDVLLNRHPIFWMQDVTYLVVIIAAAVGTPLYTRFRRIPERTLLLADAFGLALFTVIGARIGEQAHLPLLIVPVMAVITGAAGGVLRDILCAEIPLILRTDVYATASLAGAGVYLLARELGTGTNPSAILAVAVVILLRIAAIVWGLHLPRFVLREEEDQSPQLPRERPGSAD